MTIAMGCLLCLSTLAQANNASPWEKTLLEIGGRYKAYHRTSDLLNWAPVPCAPASEFLPSLKFSRSDDPNTHGQKLFFVYARLVGRGGGYLDMNGPAPYGQILVKEAWHGEAISAEAASRRAGVKEYPKQQMFSIHKDRTYYATDKAALFVMYKMEPNTPGTDQGWVYGTLTPDGKKVLEAGRIESCISCHQQSKHDRILAGTELPSTKKSKE